MTLPWSTWWRRAAVPLLCTAALLPATASAAAADGDRTGRRAEGHGGPRALAFPLNETFDSSTNLGSTSGGASYPGEGWLRLTSASTAQAGTWRMKDSFPSSLGILAEFSYATYGGTAIEGKRGDGLSFYLTDGEAAAGAGPSGGSLGYACTGPVPSRCTTSGVPGAYLGIGLDEFGNFSSSVVGNGGPGGQPNKIVVRGGGSASTGYRYATAADGPGKTVETGSRAKQRTVRVSLLPSGTKMLLSVWSDSGPGTAMDQLITDFDVTGITGQPALPATLKVGFSASTGGATNIHEIDDLQINVPADLTIAKTGSPASVPAGGGPVTYTLAVSNSQANEVTGAVVRDTVPGLTNVTWTCRAGTGGTCGRASGSGNTLDTTADFQRGGSVTYTVTGTAPAQPATLTNTATVTAPADRQDTNPADNSATAAATVVTARADVAAEKEGLGSGPVAPGEEFEYRITARNLGPSHTTAVQLSDTLPGPLRFVSSTDGCTASGQVLSCPVRDQLNAGTSTSWTVRVRLDQAYQGDGSDLGNVASLRHAVADPQPANNTSAAAAPPGGVAAARADLSLAKAAETRSPVAPGETFTYTVTVRNGGPSVARKVTVADPLPAALAFVSSPGGCSAAGRDVTCGTEAAMDPGGVRSWTFTVRLDPAYTGDGTGLRNTATARADTAEANPLDNSGSAGVPGGRVRPPSSDIELTKHATAG
ncbi:lectin-like domain-containing protein [Streptomyces sp. 4.24]|uniref:lectin-like domain-containing protein n=1 Tax=Streptomyces tritrimontium TaxID=3406573 RepID=UPI003BB5F221